MDFFPTTTMHHSIINDLKAQVDVGQVTVTSLLSMWKERLDLLIRIITYLREPLISGRLTGGHGWNEIHQLFIHFQ